MKKILALMLAAALTLSLVACGGGSGAGDTKGVAEDNKSTELTADNYAQYLNLSVKAFSSDPKFSYPDGVRVTDSYKAMMLNGTIYVNMEVSGASTNFNYNDVTIKVKATVTYYSDTYKNYFADIRTNADTHEFDLEAVTNISGNCDVIVDKFELPEGYYTHDYLVSVDYEIVDITGTVTPA